MRSKAACLSAAALATVAIAACQRQPSPEPAEKVAPPAAAPQPPAPIAAPQPVDRSELLRSLDTAASVYAAGKAPEGEVLTGRRFTVRQAFGCTGPAPPPPADLAADGLPRWSWGSERRTIEIRLTPSDWAKSALIAGNDGAWEAAEGFWLTRPWLRADGCPAPRVDPLAGPTAPSPQTMGIAAVFERGGSRLGRRNGRAYAFTVRGEGDQPPLLPVGGYRLVLEGRFVAFADGRAIRCRSAAADQRPVCVAATELDRVAFEDAGGAVLSEWRAG